MMIHLKRFNESGFINNHIFGDYNIINGIMDVDGDVLFGANRPTFDKIPFKFGIVSGEFDCSYNNIKSLIGSPRETGTYFWCHNNKLTSLKGSPEKVGDSFDCSNNKLTSLEDCPKEIGGDFYCSNNNLYNFYGIGKIYGEINYDGNPIDEIFELCNIGQLNESGFKEFITYMNEFTPIRDKTILGKRLQECLYMCDITDTDVSKLNFKNYTLLE